jgi:hypothetical protein
MNLKEGWKYRRTWTGFTCLRAGNSEGSCKERNELPGCTKCGKLLTGQVRVILKKSLAQIN